MKYYINNIIITPVLWNIINYIINKYKLYILYILVCILILFFAFYNNFRIIEE